MKDANYGPSGFIEEGQYYSPKVRQRLKDSYELLEHAITLEKATPEGFTTWILLHEPYFGDPGDPDVVRRWRQAAERNDRAGKRAASKVEYHDQFVRRLADHLRHKDLYVIHPARMTVKEEQKLERSNDEVYREFNQIREEKRNEGLSKAKANRRAVETAAVRHGYSERRVYEIVRLREREAG